MDRNLKINSQAPGKVILWGEYGVLVGGPAAVFSVDRYAKCSLDPCATSNTPAEWSIEATGVLNERIKASVEELAFSPKYQNHVIAHVIHELAESVDLVAFPKIAKAILDTSSFLTENKKIGIGSSAAICTATYAAFCKLAGVEPSLHGAFSIHKRFQNNQGSGADVAAAWHGGSFRFQSGNIDPIQMINSNLWKFFWSGRSSNTTTHISRFHSWLERSSSKPINNLIEVSKSLFECTNITKELKYYIEALRELDSNAMLGIYDGQHEQMHKLAKDSCVAYKPCGAGGGDIGAAVSDDIEALESFSEQALQIGFHEIKLNISERGIYVE